MADEPNLEARIDALGESALRVKAERDALLLGLSATVGRMRNAKIDLEVGATKAKVISALASALKTAEDLLAHIKSGA